MNSRKITALYERLSREDAHSGDSDSIAHQKAYLEQTAAARGFENCRHYTDDGWSGGSFDRPGWNDMIADIEAGKVGAVLVKDMSRVGRDYLQTGFYTEVYFARKGVRFIAVDSHVDNQAGEADFMERLQKQLQLGQPDQMKKLKRSIMAKTNRIAEIDRLLRKLYEDYALDRIPETRYDALSAEYEREQAAIEAALAGEKRMADASRTGSERIEQFMALTAKYRDCTEYSDEVLRQFVEKVVVHETQRDADGERSREIEVYLSFIGKFSVPAEPARLSPAEQKHQEALKKRRIHARNKRAQKRKERMNMK